MTMPERTQPTASRARDTRTTREAPHGLSMWLAEVDRLTALARAEPEHIQQAWTRLLPLLIAAARLRSAAWSRAKNRAAVRQTALQLTQQHWTDCQSCTGDDWTWIDAPPDTDTPTRRSPTPPSTGDTR